MPGIGIGVGLALGGGAGGALTQTGIARALAAMGLTDAEARAAIGGAASLAAGLQSVGLMPVATAPAPAPPTPSPSPTPAATSLPGGMVAMWDAASLSGLSDGDAVTSWNDMAGGIVAVQTGDSTTPHTYVANSGGLPALRLSGAAVLATAGTNAANTAMTGGERGIVIVARNIQGAGSGQANPCLVASGGGTGQLFQATPTETGRYGTMYACGDAGMRTIGYSNSDARQYAFDSINGTAVTTGSQGGGQITIGGWQNAGTSCCGVADILAVIVYDRALTAADFKQVHRHYCERLGQARPGGGVQRNVTFLGDSLTIGYPVGIGSSYPLQMVAGLGLPWGTWDQMGVAGFTWFDIKDRTAPMAGNVSGATGHRNIVCMFEFANMRGSATGDIQGAARATIDAVVAREASVDVVFGSSTDAGDGGGMAARQTRAAYNAYWDDAANRTGIAAYVPLHLDPNIGVEGAAPTDGTANSYYQADNLHLQTAGYALVDNGPHGFRAAVAARLAA